MASNDGKILKRADPSTIQDKFLVGYQGWFTCGGDGEPVGPGHHGWLHWFNAPIPDGGRVNTDLWPDVSSYSPSELFPAPGLKTAAGEQVFLFSSRHPKTVQSVPADRLQRVIERDWVHLVRNQGVLDSPNYLREKGKAVVALWGFGFENAGHTPELVRSITTYIRNMTPGGAYIMAGTPAHWRTATSDADRNPAFLDVWLNEFDAISPWTVGRYRDEKEADDFAETKMRGDVELINKRNEEGRWRKIDYIPVVLPGGSGYNLSQGKWGFNSIRRNGGRFLWQQIFNAKRLGVRVMYGAMWDEYDEGTALMPVVEKKRLLPVSDVHPFLALDEDGYDLPSDWFMRICGFAGEGLRSERRVFETFPSKELDDYWSTRPRYEDVDHKTGDFVSGASKKTMKGGSGGDAQSYQEWLAAQKEDKEEVPPPPYSLEADEQPSTPEVRAPQTTVSIPSTGGPSRVEAHTPVIAGPSSSSHLATSSVAAITEAASHGHPQVFPSRQATGPPPVVNATSRPQARTPSPLAGAGQVSTTSSAYVTETQHNASTISDVHTSPNVVSSTPDPVASLASEFNRHNLGSSDLRQSTNPSAQPPPIPGTRPPTAPTHQNYHASPSAPAPAPASQGQWPPAEWGINNDPRHQSPPPSNQASHPGQMSNLSIPQTSAYPPSRPHSAMSTRPSFPTVANTTTSQATPYGSAYPTASFHGSNASTHPPENHIFSSNPGLGGGSSYPSVSTYTGHIETASYGATGYLPPVPGFGPHVSPPHSPGPGKSYYQSSGFPVAQGSSYPGSNSYGMHSTPAPAPYGTMPYPPSNTPMPGGGFHVGHAPGADDYYGSSQSQSSGYNPGYINGSTPYGAPSGMPPSSGWYPGSSSSIPAPPMHPGRPPTQSPYPDNFNSNPWYASSSSSGFVGSALNAVDKVAGKKTRQQLESVAHD
ncbi:hypothetical protein H0H93_005446 [Arthromyces matolae]|nr:hypothetical protein H0H93_005446 [Arthromyces matolae]